MQDSGSYQYYPVLRTNSAPTDDGTPSKKSMVLLITTSSIAGAVLLVFFVYVIVRLRRGVPLIDILKLRRHAPDSYFVHSRSRSHAEEQGIHFEQRYSVRSARYQASLKSRMSSATVPPVATMPTGKQSKIIMEPHMAYLKGSDRGVAQESLTREASRKSAVPTISVRSIGEEPMSPPFTKDDHTRWSWTNSEAPSTPRVNMERTRNSRASTTLAPRYMAESTFSESQIDSRRVSSISAASKGSMGPRYPRASTPGDQRGMDAIEEDRVPQYTHKSFPSDKALEILETGGQGYLPPRPVPKAADRLTTWKSLRRNKR